MTIIYVVDAFTSRPFSGNPAAVCVLNGPADETWMKCVALEMNLSETAFLHPITGGFSLRWLTPSMEVKLCGHATLASALTLWETEVLKHNEPARFNTLSGWLTCQRKEQWIEMDFPAVVCRAVAAPVGLADALGSDLLSCGLNGMDYLVEVADEKTLRSLKPNYAALAKLPVRGIIVTCHSESAEFDFISRFFAPAAGVNEDPVTGSAHCALGPYWQLKLGKSDLIAYQASDRGGVVKLSVQGDRVMLCGQAVMMSRIDMMH
ncbi:MAG: PhzF family phenazine biosynthesis protein [Pirellula sp.]